jgi:hypothetical protein
MKIAGFGAGSGKGSGTVSQSHRYGSADPDPDPDPYQKVTDPQHRWTEKKEIVAGKINITQPLRNKTIIYQKSLAESLYPIRNDHGRAGGIRQRVLTDLWRTRLSLAVV